MFYDLGRFGDVDLVKYKAFMFNGGIGKPYCSKVVIV